MPPRRQHYDPAIQDGPPPEVEMPPLRGALIETPDTYVLASDVADVLLRMAERYHQEGRGALLEASEWFRQVDAPDAAGELPGPQDVALGFVREDGTTQTLADWVEHGTPPDAVHADDGSRVELYLGGSPRPGEEEDYWYARLVDHAGVTVEDGAQGIDQAQVVRDAEARWPGRMIHQVHGPLGDSRWDEQDSTATFNGQRRPSAQRLWGRT